MTVPVSIIIPCFNQGHYLREALQSIEQCGDKNLYEIIIVNDGSTENATINILEEYKRKGYTVIDQPNKGLGAARNAGIKIAGGKYIIPLDSDNKIRPEMLHEGIKLLDASPDIDVVYGDAEYFGEKTGLWKNGEFNLQRMMIENYIDACAMFRKSTWEKVNGYDEKMPAMGCEDWDLWLRIAFDGGKFRYVNKILFDYRYSSFSMIRIIQQEKLIALLEYMENKHKGYLNRAYLNSLILLITYKRKKLAFYIFLSSFFPGLCTLLRKAGFFKKMDVL